MTKDIFCGERATQKRTVTALAGIAVFAFVPLYGVGADNDKVPALVRYHVVADGIPTPLTSRPGNSVEGEKVVEDRKLGNCLSCHAFPLKAADPGNVGPDLRGVGSRYKAAQLRLRVVNMKVLDPQTIMPAYYRVDGLHDVGKAFVGKTILDPQQVEDLVAYLATLTTKGTSR